MGRAPATGLTATGRLLVLGITALSVAHHVDHVLRDNTGWPLQEGFNPFSASLFVYPVIVAGVILSERQRVRPPASGPFWPAARPCSSPPCTSARQPGMVAGSSPSMEPK